MAKPRHNPSNADDRRAGYAGAPEHGGARSDRDTPSSSTGGTLGKLLKGWLVTLLISAGPAAIIAALVLIPFTVESWDKAELELPGYVELLVARRWLVAAGVAAVMAIGALGLFLVRNRVISMLIFALCALVLILADIAVFVGWWMLYVDAFRQASEL